MSSTKWSPFECLAVGRTTASGLLEMAYDTEVELLVQFPVELRAAVADEPLVPLRTGDADGSGDDRVDDRRARQDWVDRRSGLQAIVTTHRLVFLADTTSSSTTTTGSSAAPQQQQQQPSQQQRQARYLHLCNLFSTQEETRFMKSPKLLLNTAFGDLFMVYPSGHDGKKQRDECHERLQQSMTRKQWEQDEQKQIQQQQRPTSYSRRKVGVDAIVTKSQQKHRQAAQLTDTAFQGDAETLLREATELVAIIHKYVATLDRSSSAAAASNEQDADRLVNLLSDMGMTSALRKADYKGRENAYYETTARQLADFVRPKLAQCQGVMTLTDVYCLFNRARGSHLLSPEDLLQAVDCLDRLQIGITCYTFPDSGLKVLRDDRATDEALAATFLQLCSGDDGAGFVTALSVSRATHVSAVLALEQLQASERATYLVRDETLESVRFYPNRFRDEWCRD